MLIHIFKSGPERLARVGQVLRGKARNRKPIPAPGLSFEGLDRFPDNCQPHEGTNYLEECKRVMDRGQKPPLACRPLAGNSSLRERGVQP